MSTETPFVKVSKGRIRIAGELIMQRAEELKPALLAALPEAEGIARLDLSRVSEIDTSGLQILMAADREVTARGGVLQIVAASSAVAEVLALFRQQHLLATPDTESRQ